MDLALGAVTKVIGDGLDTNRQRKLIDDFIATGGTALNAPPASEPAVSPAPPAPSAPVAVEA